MGSGPEGRKTIEATISVTYKGDGEGVGGPAGGEANSDRKDAKETDSSQGLGVTVCEGQGKGKATDDRWVLTWGT